MKPDMRETVIGSLLYASLLVPAAVVFATGLTPATLALLVVWWVAVAYGMFRLDVSMDKHRPPPQR